MALIIRPALASDAQSIGNLARQFASYLRELGDLTDFKLTANAYLRDGFARVIRQTNGEAVNSGVISSNQTIKP